MSHPLYHPNFRSGLRPPTETDVLTGVITPSYHCRVHPRRSPAFDTPPLHCHFTWSPGPLLEDRGLSTPAHSSLARGPGPPQTRLPRPESGQPRPHPRRVLGAATPSRPAAPAGTGMPRPPLWLRAGPGRRKGRGPRGEGPAAQALACRGPSPNAAVVDPALTAGRPRRGGRGEPLLEPTAAGSSGRAPHSRADPPGPRARRARPRARPPPAARSGGGRVAGPRRDAEGRGWGGPGTVGGGDGPHPRPPTLLRLRAPGAQPVSGRPRVERVPRHQCLCKSRRKGWTEHRK